MNTFTRFLTVLLAAAVLLAVASPSASAATTYTWTQSTAGTWQWSGSGNWDPNGVPASASTTTVKFNPTTVAASATVTANNDLGTLTLNKLSFSGSGSSSTLTLTGGDLSFAADGANLPTISLLNSNNGVTQNVYNNLILTANTTITSVGDESLYLYGNISGVGTLTVGNGNRGQIFLLGSNSFAGPIVFNNSYYARIGSDAALGTLPLVVTPGSISVTGAHAYISAQSGTVTINANRGINVASGATLDLGKDASADLIYNGIIAGPGNVIVSTRTTTLGGLNTYTGQTSLDGGTLVTPYIADLGQPSGLGAPTTDANGVISDNGVLTYTGTGASTNRRLYIGSFDVGIANNGTGLLQFTSTAGNAVTGSCNGNLRLSGTGPGGLIAGAIPGIFNTSYRGLAIVSGTWTLTGANSYANPTMLVSSGVLQANDGVGLPSGSNLRFAGDAGTGVSAVLQNNATAYTFTRPLGTSGGQVTWSTGSGGFAAQGAKFIVNIGGSSATLTWGSTTDFVTSGQSVVFGSATADNEIEFQNPINLNGAARTVLVTDDPNSTTDVARLSGSLSGTGSSGLIKTGGGTLILSAGNSYAGTTTVSGGVLRLAGTSALPGGIGSGGTSALTLSGGVVELGAGDFQRGLGTGSAQVQFTGSGGFSAYGANRAVNLGGSGTPSQVTWASGSFVPNGSSLILGSATANAQVDFQNPINLNGAVRTIQVDDNPNSAADQALISGIISGTGNSGLTKTGNGKLFLSNINTYTGGTTVSAGTLLVKNSSGSGTGSGNVTVSPGATLGGTGTIAPGANKFTLTAGTGSAPANWGGVVSPGASIGTLSLTGDLDFQNYGVFMLDANGNAIAPNNSDLLAVTGSIAFGANAIVKLASWIGDPTGDAFTLFTYTGSVTGTPIWIIDTSGTGWTGGAVTIGGGAITLTGLVPEPATLSLLALGCLALFRRRNR